MLAFARFLFSARDQRERSVRACANFLLISASRTPPIPGSTKSVRTYIRLARKASLKSCIFAGLLLVAALGSAAKIHLEKAGKATV
jgi:hypothetical protein